MHANIGRNILIWPPGLEFTSDYLCETGVHKLGIYIHIQSNRLLEYGMKNIFRASKEKGFGGAKLTTLLAKIDPSIIGPSKQYNEEE